jgi:hypothetical protein
MRSGDRLWEAIGWLAANGWLAGRPIDAIRKSRTAQFVVARSFGPKRARDRNGSPPHWENL